MPRIETISHALIHFRESNGMHKKIDDGEESEEGKQKNKQTKKL